MRAEVSTLTRRRAMAGGAAALIVAPFVIRHGFAQSRSVNIGVVQPLSGANAQFGINCRNGIELVADSINAAGGIKALGGAKINLIVSDATSNPVTASTVAQHLITQNELTAVLGAFVSSLTLAIRREQTFPFSPNRSLTRSPAVAWRASSRSLPRPRYSGGRRSITASQLRKRPAVRSRRSRLCTRTLPTASPNPEVCAEPQRTPTLRS